MTRETLTTWTIYKDPRDAPAGYHYVVRGFDAVGAVPVPRQTAVAAQTLEQARAWIAANTRANVRFPRAAADDSCIVETWL